MHFEILNPKPQKNLKKAAIAIFFQADQPSPPLPLKPADTYFFEKQSSPKTPEWRNATKDH